MTAASRTVHVAAELERARAMRESAGKQAAIGEFDSAASRLYFAAVHACRALLASIDVEPRSHRGLRHLISLHFVKPGRVAADLASRLGDLQEAREGSDYVADYTVSAVEYRELAAAADAILDEVARVLGDAAPR